MNSSDLITTVGYIVIGMAVLALVETVIPLRARGRWGRAHLAPNLALTAITFATNAFFNVALVLTLDRMQANPFGVLSALTLHPLAYALVVVAVLDFSFYVAHVSMHAIPAFWRFHRVHHADPLVDVTTTVRQHPGEGVIRYAFMAVFAIAIGASPAAFGIYRVWSAVGGLLEHANIAVPRGLANALALVTTWPDMHKIHHSRRPTETDTNYGNVFSFWDRLFGTYTPARRDVVYGLDGFDDTALQTTAGLLALPFRVGDSRSQTMALAERA